MKDDRMAQADLRRVRKAAEKIRSANEECRAAIVAARASGETLRDIAEAAGLSHQRVHQILSEQR